MLMTAVLSVSFMGCGGLPANVEGVVTLDGQPLRNGRIWFHPDASGPVAYGQSLDDGSYRLKTGAKQIGLLPGSYRVTVVAMEAQDPTSEEGKLLTPPVYGDPAKTLLRVQVSKGTNKIPLALESATASGEVTTR
jgi:hypothetical protein